MLAVDGSITLLGGRERWACVARLSSSAIAIDAQYQGFGRMVNARAWLAFPTVGGWWSGTHGFLLFKLTLQTNHSCAHACVSCCEALAGAEEGLLYTPAGLPPSYSYSFCLLFFHPPLGQHHLPAERHGRRAGQSLAILWGVYYFIKRQ